MPDLRGGRSGHGRIQDLLFWARTKSHDGSGIDEGIENRQIERATRKPRDSVLLWESLDPGKDQIMTQESKPSDPVLAPWPKERPLAFTFWFQTSGDLFFGTPGKSPILHIPCDKVQKLVELGKLFLKKDKTLAERLDVAERVAKDLGEKAAQAEDAWKLEEARTRLKQKARNEAPVNGKKKMWNSKDVDSQVLIIQSNPKNPLGKAWIEMCATRAASAEAKVEARSLSRQHWEETKRW